MSLSVSLLLNKPHTQESTVLLLRWAGTTEDYIGLFSTKAFLSQCQPLLNPSFHCALNAVSPRPHSLCVSFMSSYFYPVPSIKTYLSLSFFFFSFKIPSPASYILGGKTPQCGNSKSILIVRLSLQWRSSGNLSAENVSTVLKRFVGGISHHLSQSTGVFLPQQKMGSVVAVQSSDLRHLFLTLFYK